MAWHFNTPGLGSKKSKDVYVLLDNESPVTEVIDVMAVGGTGHLKVSLAYFLVNVYLVRYKHSCCYHVCVW